MAPRQADETTGLLDQEIGMSSYQLDQDKRFSKTSKGGNVLPLFSWGTLVNVAVLALALVFFWKAHEEAHRQENQLTWEYSTNSKYTQVQGMGFQIYTGGAPAYLNETDAQGNNVPNPECFGLASYGSMWTEDGEALQCYIGKGHPERDVQARLTIMKDAVEAAYRRADSDPSILKIFIAPEFFWRGVDGAYVFDEEEPGDVEICGPVCQVLQGLEAMVADKRFEDWFFLFGTIVAAEPLPSNSTYDSLFYNFAPIYKGYDPQRTTYEGKRFIAPKRYLSTSDFMTPQRHLNASSFKELIDREQRLYTLQQREQPPVHDERNGSEKEEDQEYPDFDDDDDDQYFVFSSPEPKDNVEADAPQTVINPVFTRGKYDNDLWDEYKDELDGLGYTLLEYGWLMLDGLSLSVEICLDHQLKSSLTSYVADSTTGHQTQIPSSTDEGLTYTSIPRYQAQLGVVSSAGMTVTTESLALTNKGTIFLQDGLSNDTNAMYWSSTGCELGLQFEGGTEAVQREAFVSPTDIFFEHKALQRFERHNIYGNRSEGWERAIHKSFSTKVYPPQLTVFDVMEIAKVHHQ